LALKGKKKPQKKVSEGEGDRTPPGTRRDAQPQVPLVGGSLEPAGERRASPRVKGDFLEEKSEGGVRTPWFFCQYGGTKGKFGPGGCGGHAGKGKLKSRPI